MGRSALQRKSKKSAITNPTVPEVLTYLISKKGKREYDFATNYIKY